MTVRRLAEPAVQPARFAFNAANALGPWLGGLAIAAGHGWTSTGWVGVALAFGGLMFWAVSLAFDRR